MTQKILTQEEKDLLKNVLCEMLPYGVKVAKGNVIYPLTGINIALGYVELAISERISIEDARPYLRPLSSITEEEEFELNGLLHEVYDFSFRMEELLETIQMQKTIPFQYIDWLLKHHFDYRGLIEKGLALPAKENMYND